MVRLSLSRERLCGVVWEVTNETSSVQNFLNSPTLTNLLFFLRLLSLILPLVPNFLWSAANQKLILCTPITFEEKLDIIELLMISIGVIGTQMDRRLLEPMI